MPRKYFFIALAISLPFWWVINIFQKDLESFFVWQMVKDDPQMFLAQAGIQPIVAEYPIRRARVEDLSPESLTAVSALAVEIGRDDFPKTLFKKNSNEKRPIASITKLMTADIVLQNLDLMQPIKVSRTAIGQEGPAGKLKVGETLLAHDLLYIALMESSNDAAYVLAEQIGVDEFVNKMQERVEALGMRDTFFVNVTGADPDPPDTEYNYSTANDLVRLIETLLAERPKIWEILNTDKIDLYSPDGEFHHTLVNTNRLINGIPRIVGAKTGWTPLAKESLIQAQESSRQEGYLVYVILGSEDRFGEMKRLVEWVNEAWKW